jgi:hypothetical protein
MLTIKNRISLSGAAWPMTAGRLGQKYIHDVKERWNNSGT